ncbi:MAG: cobaltochelatase subunit CobN [Pseudomonadota bacterium]
MHLLASEVTTLDEVETAIDLEQSPADVVVLSFADSDLAAFASAWASKADDLSSLRLASLKLLRHPMSVDMYIERVINKAKAVVVRCLGGVEYWPYGLAQIAQAAKARGILFAALPGDYRDDPRLVEMSTMSADDLTKLDGLMRAGGQANATRALRFIDKLLGRGGAYEAPELIPSVVCLRADGETANLSGCETCDCVGQQPVALVLFYRAALLAADTAPVTALMAKLREAGLSPIAVAVSSLKDPTIAEALTRLIRQRKPAVILNTTAFSGLRDDNTTVLDAADTPVLQVILSGQSHEGWVASARGLSATDMAMNVVLPELDGRLMTRAVSFKAVEEADQRLEFGSARHQADVGRIEFVAQQAAAWARLKTTPQPRKKLAIILSDYPARGGRAGYAVGLDTPRSVEGICRRLAADGYDLGQNSVDAEDVNALIRGETAIELRVPVAAYQAHLKTLPPEVCNSLRDAWGEAADDCAVREDAFVFRVIRTGNVLVALQPDRGLAADHKATYHDMTVPPRHAYVAFYWWLRTHERTDAIVHMGTHGTLEWLPGKAIALSETCWPEVVLGPLPVIYPFIVNNPGEAVQAKRRLGAIALGHLTPPLSAAGLTPDMAELEALIEEYAEAEGMDPRRVMHIEQAIVDRMWSAGLAEDCGLSRDISAREAIEQLDAQLCDLKELSIRDRLHVFGVSPDQDAEDRLVETICKAEPAFQSGDAREQLRSGLEACGPYELDRLVGALSGQRVPPGPAGAPSRGRADVLPTGRNITSVDPRAMPTRVSSAIGVRAAEEVIRRYLQDQGEYPRALMVDLWASAALRTGGDDLAQALWYLGVRPVWDSASSRVTGVEMIPLAQLARPRIDVTLRVSGLFRDIFEGQIALFDLAVRQVAARDEADDDNPLAAVLRSGGDLWRIFGSSPGTYGAGAGNAALDTDWTDRDALGQAYLANATHAFSADGDHASAGTQFEDRVRASDALVHAQDDRECDMLDGDGFADFIGGFAAAASALGVSPELYQIDTSTTDAPVARKVSEEIARLVRARLVNPRWIEGMLGHGARGVAEIAQAVDALYAFQATAECVPGHLLDIAHAALLADADVRDRMMSSNPAAVQCMAERFHDLMQRGLWVSRRNSVGVELEAVLGRRAGVEAAE